MRRLAKASPARSHTTIGGMAFGLACFCLLAFTAIAGAGTAAAAECPNEAIRIAQGATQLPDCRGYEQVSPADSAGGVVGVEGKNNPLSAAMRADGNAATFGSSSAVGETERGATTTSNFAHRTADGWSSYNVLTVTDPSVPLDLSMLAGWPTPSSDMSRMMFASPRSLGPPNPITTGGSVYLSAPGGKGAPTWLSRWSFSGTQPDPKVSSVLPLGGSPDLSSGYFRYGTPLTNIAGDDLRATSEFGLYHFEGETITPAGVLPSGTVSPLGAVPAGIGSAGAGGGAVGPVSMTEAELAGNQVSADGSKLFFVSPAETNEPKQLYVEEGGAPGRLVSHDLAGNPAPSGLTTLGGTTQRVGLAFATPDGSRVVFRSESVLTADAPSSGVKTYRAEITPSAITLTYLPGIDTVEHSVLRISDDASMILYSVTNPATTTASFYVWDEDHPGSPYTIATGLRSFSGPVMREAVFSKDGDVLVFTSDGEVEPGVPGPYMQIYRWTKASGLACISCRRDGGAPARFGAHMSIWQISDNPAYPNGGAPNSQNQSTVVGNRKISSDGSRVFFDTSDPLDPVHDVNGTRDVYMWENGTNYLLTSGRGDAPSQVLDSSESGNDVMLVTKDALVPSDTDQTYDVYDVRVDGGFAEPVKDSCEGAACQASRAAPAEDPPASLSVSGPGNRQRARLGAVKVVQIGKPGKTAKVRVSVPAAGHLKLTGKLVKGKSRSVKAEGAVKLHLTLTKAGKKKLAAKDHLAAKVTATFRDSNGGTKKNSVTLRFKQGGHR